jgi:hypothetical protein
MKNSFAVLLLLTSVFLFSPGCASNWTKNNGSSEQDDAVKTLFETCKFVSDYKYFFDGYASSPEAILGIQRDFELIKVSGWANKSNWHQFETDGAKLKELVEAMRRQRQYGYVIKAPAGNQIGVLYTSRRGTRYKTEVRLMGGNQLAVTPHKYDSTWAPSK